MDTFDRFEDGAWMCRVMGAEDRKSHLNGTFGTMRLVYFATPTQMAFGAAVLQSTFLRL